jgi:hypothetical protein
VLIICSISYIYFSKKAEVFVKNLLPYLLIIAAMYSCNKRNDVGNPWNFSWSHKGTNYHASKADAYISPFDLSLGPNQVVAYVPSMPSYKLSIKLTSLNPGTYSIGAGNNIGYIDEAGFELQGVEGTVTIQANASNQLSGSFSAKLLQSPSDTTVINGSFINISLHP